MKNEKKTKKQLIDELRMLRRKLARWEASKSRSKAAEETLREREKNYRAMAENANDGILIATAKGVYVYANRRAAEITGYSVADLLKLTMKDLTHPQEIKKVTERFRKRLAGKAVPRQYETTIVRKDGRSVPIELTASKTLWHGQPAGLVIFRDITGRKRAEELLKESEAKFKTLAEQSPNMIFINKKGKVIYANERCEEILGYKREEFYSPDFDFLDLIAPEYVALVKANFDRHMKGKEVESIEYALVTKDGKRVAAILATRLIDYGGEEAILGIVTDITERKRAEEELRKYRKHLEELVEERTAELQRANEQLKREIEERKQVEETLRESEDKLLKITGAAKDAIIMIDQDGNILFWNKAAEKIFGHSQKEVTGKNLHRLVVPNRFQDRFREGFGNFQRTGRGPIVGKTSEFVALRRGGQEFPVELSLASVKIKGKWNAVGIVRNITERKRAEDALRESEEKYRELADLLPQTVFELDLEGNILITNRYGFESFGYTQEDIDKSLNALQLFIPEDRERAQQNIQKRLRGESFEDHEYTALRKDGRTFPVLIYSSPIIHDDKPVGLRGVVLDITQRKRMETVQQVLYRIANAVHTTENLNELFTAIHQELGAVLNTENFFIALFDMESDTISFPYHKNERDPYVETLPAGKTLTGYVIRNDKPLLITGKGIEKMTQTGEIEILGVIPKIWLGVPMKAKGKIIGALVVQNYTDETAIDEKDMGVLEFVSGQVGLSIERKRAEEKLKQTMADLARSNAELEQFAYIASHDLQEPLQAVAMSMEIVARRCKAKLDAEASKFIDYAVNESRRMQMLVEDLLAYSRVDKGGKEFEPTDCLLVLDQTLDNLLVPIERSGAKITHDPLPTVMSDPLHLTQLFQNLIDNAIKFHGQEPPRIHISAKRKKGEWLFSVRDNGIGFDPKHVHRIFNAFERLLDRTEYPGTGIGLAICRKIVERHGGRIWAESKPGKGATFYFTIPTVKGAIR